MRRNVLFMAMLMMVSLVCTSAQAQGRRGDMRDARPGDRRELALRDGRRGTVSRPEMRPSCPPVSPRPGVVVHGGPRLDAHGYVSGWHGRVRYVDGRWGYLRGNDWYWYNVYYEPAYYFSHPVTHFRGRLGPAGKVVAGAVGAAAVGAFVAALCR